MKAVKIFLLFAIFAASGCELIVPQIELKPLTNTTSAVLVVIEDSFIGQNIGANADLQMMSNMVSTVTDDIVVLKNGMATKRNVKAALSRACSNELAIVFFTCHGGHEHASKDSLLEKDGYDEFIYLADTTIDDNELYDIFKTSTNRVFTIFNCCNAGTMFATTQKNVETSIMFLGAAYESDNAQLNLLSWSACGDGEKAVTTKEGGEFVKSIYRTFNAFNGNVTYGECWSVVRNSKELKKYQRPELNYIGDYKKFDDIKLFK